MSLDPSFEATIATLRQVRNHMLRLHKALIDSERVGYEQFHGPIRNSGEFLQLLLEDEWFAWLRSMSQYVVEVDEFLASKTPVELSDAQVLLLKAKLMLNPDEEDDGLFSQRYRQALQRAEVLEAMHREVAALLL